MTTSVFNTLRVNGALIVDGYEIDISKLPRRNTAATNTIYVNSVSGDDSAAGDVGTPLRTLAEASLRIGDGFTGANIIQLDGYGPYVDPGTWPKQGPDGWIYIIGDRSSPAATNASPTFAATSGKNAQHEAAAFGSAVATTEGTHWTYADLSSFGFASFAYQAYANLTRSAPEVAFCASSANSGVPHEVHPWITTVDFGLGAGKGAQGIQYLGIIATSSIPFNFQVSNYAFLGTRFDLNSQSFSAESSGIGGYINNLSGTSNLTINDGSANNLIVRSGELNVFQLGGNANIFGSVVEHPITILAGTNADNISFNDIEGGSGFNYGANCFMFIRSTSVTGASSLMTPLTGTFGGGIGSTAKFGTSVSGSTSDVCIVLVDGASVIDAAANLDGNLTNSGTPGDEVTVGGLGTYSFSELPRNDFGLGPTSQGCRAE